jgi:hypothetical protein
MAEVKALLARYIFTQTVSKEKVALLLVPDG